MQSDLALLAMTGIIAIITCIIEGQAFAISIQLGGMSKGAVDDPEFYNAHQTFLMQTLALYTVLIAALRSNGPRYEFWAWLLAALSLGLGTASVAGYPFFTMLSPFLACPFECLACTRRPAAGFLSELWRRRYSNDGHQEDIEAILNAVIIFGLGNMERCRRLQNRP